MLLTVLLLFIVTIFGLSLVNFLKTNLNCPEKISVGFTLGLSFFTILSFLFSNIIGLTYWTIITSTILIILTSIILSKIDSKYTTRINYKNDFLKILKDRYSLFTLVFFTILFTYIFTHHLVREPEGLFAGSMGTWGDGALHLTLINSFLKSDNFWPQQPLFSGARLSYPFLPDFSSSILLKLGVSLTAATGLPAILLLIASVVMLYSIFFKETNSRLVASMALFIVFFLGGFGFIYFFEDLLKTNFSISTFTYPLREYTSMGSEKGIHYINLITSPIVSQRAFLFGFPLLLGIYSILKDGLVRMDKRQFIFAGILVGILPFFHSHTLLTLGIILPVLALVKIFQRPKREFKKVISLWIIFGIVASTLIIPQLFLFFSPNTTANTIRLHFGWLAYVKNDNFFWFWLKNTGLLIPLIISSPIVLGKQKFIKLFKFYLPFLAIFIVANVIVFQPLEYDNSKLFNYWYIFSAPLAASVIAVTLQKLSYIYKIIGVLLFTAIILSGLLDVSRLNNYQKNRILLLDNEDINFADFVSKNTNPHAVFATGSQHNHPIPVLSGRKILVGYTGWLWTYGINYGKREQDLRKIYLGDHNTKTLLENYNVDYLVVGPGERSQFIPINDQFFEENFSLIYSSMKYKLYKIEKST